MTSHPPALHVLDGLGFPEALRWRDGALWFSDMFRSNVIRWTPGMPAEIVLDPASGGPAVPGGLGWLPEGDLLVVDTSSRRVLRNGPAGVTTHAELTAWMTHPANDMHVDPDGTAWVGGYGFDPENEKPRASSLLRIGADGSVSPTSAELVFPNGCERSPDGALVVAETFADRVSVLDPAADTRQASIELAPGSGPDGLSIGPQGDIYLALAFVGQVVRLVGGQPQLVYRPADIPNGPGAGPTGCYDCAIHPDGTHLAIAIASLDEELAARTDTGRIVILPLTTPGDE